MVAEHLKDNTGLVKKRWKKEYIRLVFEVTFLIVGLAFFATPILMDFKIFFFEPAYYLICCAALCVLFVSLAIWLKSEIYKILLIGLLFIAGPFAAMLLTLKVDLDLSKMRRAEIREVLYQEGLLSERTNLYLQDDYYNLYPKESPREFREFDRVFGNCIYDRFQSKRCDYFLQQFLESEKRRIEEEKGWERDRERDHKEIDYMLTHILKDKARHSVGAIK